MIPGMKAQLLEDNFCGWMQRISKRRTEETKVGPTGLIHFSKCRVRQLSGPNAFPVDNLDQNDLGLSTTAGSTKKGVLYWMSRDQRIQDNWALLYAQRLAIKFKTALHVCFCLVPTFACATWRQYHFMLAGLREVEQV
ncbi:unnamed protein product [Protopolystoma xenopodis]|uniref:Photolyase/cryptochrome alpha/beta domain-containing protein n=1 Tax=Protopolystoma xenopodis TaxID=117903 RepID=A0A3S5B5G4_9PLAT|nr:unnamed protein product [Protopolystoma xenopodis]